MEEGVMPNLKRLSLGGAKGTLRTVEPPLTPPGWASIMTGRSPGNHGVFDFFAFESDDSRHVRLTNSSHLQCETIWSMLSRQGLRSNVLNFPLTAPPRPMLGNMVPGWVSWRYLRRYCYPQGLYERIKPIAGIEARDLGMDLNLERRAVDGCPPEEQEAWIDLHIRRERQWFSILRELMISEPAPLTAIVFDGVDKLQHLFWPLLQPRCLGRPLTANEEKLRGLCLGYFRQIDQFIAEIVSLAGAEASLFIVSDHGFGPSRSVFHINTWLEQEGYLRWAGEPDIPAEARSAEGSGLGLIGWMYKLIDWEKTVAFALTPSSNGIHICVQGERGTAGIEASAYEGLRQKLATDLRQLIDPETASPLITQVLTREEAFPGRANEGSPDLTLCLNEGVYISTARSDQVLRHRPDPLGTHRPEGVIMAFGSQIAPGAGLEGASVLDVTPTLLYSLGLPVPGDLEGRPLIPAFAERRSVTRSAPTQSAEAAAGASYLPEEEEEVLARLRALGYVE